MLPVSRNQLRLIGILPFLCLINRLGQGRDKALQYLRDNPLLQEEIEKVICFCFSYIFVFDFFKQKRRFTILFYNSRELASIAFPHNGGCINDFNCKKTMLE